MKLKLMIKKVYPATHAAGAKLQAALLVQIMMTFTG
jgi:hypothetical protein